jgi:hypothetical protein
MDLQSRKLQFIEEFLRLTNENVIEKLEALLLKEKKKIKKGNMSHMSLEEFYLRNARSQSEIKAGKIISHQDARKHFQNKK